MATFREFVVASFVVALLAWPAGAATYYVAQGDPKASDENNGSEATPFKTIVASFKGLKAGDTVLVKKGTYREVILLSANGGDKCPPFPSGTSYQRMTSLAAFPGDEVVVKGSDVITGWKQHKDKIWYSENAPAPVILPILFCDDKRLDIVGDWSGTFSDMIKRMSGSVEVWKGWKEKQAQKLENLTPNSYFYDKDAKRLYVWLADGSDPNKHVIEITMRSGLSVQGTYMRVSGIKILQASAGMGGSHNIMENSESSDSAWGGFGLYGEFNTIVGCKFNRNGDSGMGGSGRGHRIINCETSYNNFLKISAGWHSGGCKFIPFCSDIVMSGHVAAYNIECPGIWFDGGNFNITVENSVSHHNICGIFYEISERGTFRNNICYDNTEWGGIALSSCSDCQVFNNILWRNYASGVACNGGDRSWSPFGEGEKQRLPARNNVIWGNIFINNFRPGPANSDRGTPELLMPEGVDINSGNVSDYNIFYRGPDRVLRFYKGGNPKLYEDLAQWQKAGWDEHSIVAEPLFVDIAKFDFHPAKGSPAIEFEKPRMGAQYDFNGQMRPTQERKDKKPIRFTAGPFEYKPDGK